jgi:hypothetical protein
MQRSQPINEITALLSGSQVATPNFQVNRPAGIPTTDVGGLINQNFDQRQGNYNTQMAQWQSGIGGLFGLGRAAIMASDVRLKTDIQHVGETKGGLPIYTYRYKAGGPMQMGVMAQDVARVNPDAVAHIGGGYLGVDYGRIS